MKWFSEEWQRRKKKLQNKMKLKRSGLTQQLLLFLIAQSKRRERQRMPRKRKKDKIEYRYYQMPEGSPILALLGEKWKQNYGRDVDYLHFHNYLEIGFCYYGEGTMTYGEEIYPFHGREFTIIPKNFPHTTDSAPGDISYWEYLFIDVDKFCQEITDNAVRAERIMKRINSRALFLRKRISR